jgi:hypothetical protein
MMVVVVVVMMMMMMMMIIIIIMIYRQLDDRGSIPGKGTFFFVRQWVQTCSQSRLASYRMGTAGTFPGA